MSNRADSRQHGLHMIKARQPKKKYRVKKVRADRRASQQSRQQKIFDAVTEFITKVSVPKEGKKVIS